MQRPLVIVACLLLAGLLIGAGVPALGGWVALLMIMVLAGTALMAWRRRDLDAGSRMITLAVLPLGIWLAAGPEMDWEEAQRDLAVIPEQEVVTIEGVLAHEPRLTRGGMILTLQPARITAPSGAQVTPTLPMDLQIFSDAEIAWDVSAVAMGDRFVGEGHLVRQAPTRNPGGFDRQVWHRQRGIAGAVRVVLPETVTWTPGEPTAWARWLRSMRHAREWVASSLIHQQGWQAGTFAQAMILGDRRLLAPATEQAFIHTGLGHLFAVSGLHTGLVFGLLFGFLRLLRVPRRGALALSLVALVPFMAMVGFKVSVVRASIMIAALVAGRLLERNVSALSGLALAVVIICLLDPRAPMQPGFQMSFLAVLALIAHAPLAMEITGSHSDIRRRRDRGRFALVMRRAGGALLLLIALQLAMLPLMAQHFRLVSWMAIPMNAILCLGALVLMAGSVTSLLLAVVWPWAGNGLGWATGEITRAMLDLVNWVGSWPGVAPSLSPMPWWMIGLWYLLLFGGAGVLRAKGRDQILRRRARWAIAWAAMGTLLIWMPMTRGGEEVLRVTFLDVGQGDSSIIETPGGQVIVIDGGRRNPRDMGEAVVAPALRMRGITAIDLLVATHVDADHIGGLIHLLERFPVARVGEGDRTGETETLQGFHRASAVSGARRLMLDRGDLLREGRVAVRVLHPDPDSARRALQDSNNRSVVLSVEMGETEILIMGDAEFPSEHAIMAAYPDLDTDVLRTGHHGSRHSTGSDFLAQVTPALSVISCGANPYGHPTPEVLQRLREAASLTLRTDQVGAVTVETDGRTLWVTVGG